MTRPRLFQDLILSCDWSGGGERILVFSSLVAVMPALRRVAAYFYTTSKKITGAKGGEEIV